MLPTVSTRLFPYNFNSAQSGGNITNEGSSPVIERGVCWNNFPKPTIHNRLTRDGQGMGPFTSLITGLSPDSTYYVRAYAKNSEGIAYGNEVIFNTLRNLPVVTTNPVTHMTPVSAFTGGSVVSEGTAPVTTKGICWNISGNPTINDFQSGWGSTGIGDFVRSATNLDPNTTYYLRAYAMNSYGTAYGNQEVFTTPQNFEHWNLIKSYIWYSKRP